MKYQHHQQHHGVDTQVLVITRLLAQAWLLCETSGTYVCTQAKVDVQYNESIVYMVALACRSCCTNLSAKVAVHLYKSMQYYIAYSTANSATTVPTTYQKQQTHQ
jgi:hypothetical protein